MDTSSNIPTNIVVPNATRYLWAIAIVWTIAMTTLLLLNFNRTDQTIQNVAIAEARTHFNKDRAFRFWATEHGGVYVPVDSQTLPNPYLIDIPERDIETPSGKQLTLMNPAYAMRQMNEDFADLSGIIGHITSLDPIRPLNTPDEWERAALKAFVDGETEKMEFVDIDGVPYLRLMQPMFAEEKCLKCHEQQGYEIGDVRGGVSVSLPMSPMLARQQKTDASSLLSLGVMWLLGMIGIFIGGRAFNRRVKAHRQDVLALQQAHDQLQQEREMFTNGSVAVFKWKNQDKWPVEYASPNVADLLGYTAETFLQGDVVYADIIHSEDIMRVTDEVLFASQSQNERFEHLPYRLLHPDGTCIWVLDYTTILRNDDGEATHYVGYLIDITAWKKTEESLRESEERLALVLEGTELGMWDWNIPTNNVIFNARWAEMLGYDLSEIEQNGNSWRKLRHPDDVEKIRSALTDHMNGHTSIYQVERRMRSKTGEWIWVLDSGKIFVRDKNGNPIRIAGTQMDITKRKQLEEQIVRQERMAAVGQLSAGIAHDFNNILAAILLHTELLQRWPDIPDKVQDHLSIIAASGQRAATLVRQILDFSQRTMRRPQQIDLESLLQESVRFLETTLPENIHSDLRIDAGDYMMMADSGQLQQAITNLVINARYAMPSGGTLQITLSMVDDVDTVDCAICTELIAARWIRIEVIDSGMGISADVLSHIFEPFFTTREIGEGTGLGLSQVAGIVAQHDGHIHVDSGVGQGTNIALYLPPLAVDDTAVETDEGQGKVIKHGNNETILLVEDDAVVVEATTAVLNYLGYQVIVASSGEDAITVFDEQHEQINLVLSDMMMPAMSGATLFRQLRAKSPYLKVILMSGYPLEDEGRVLLEEGMVAWLSKPITLEDLSQAVSKALASEKGRWG